MNSEEKARLLVGDPQMVAKQWLDEYCPKLVMLDTFGNYCKTTTEEILKVASNYVNKNNKKFLWSSKTSCLYIHSIKVELKFWRMYEDFYQLELPNRVKRKAYILYPLHREKPNI